MELKMIKYIVTFFNDKLVQLPKIKHINPH
jgi:hypothetical protein